MTGDPEGHGERFTIDQLSRESGITTRNIRAFQSEGMLPGPEIQGRTGYYGQQHLQRLRLIDRLQAQGFSRASIATLLQTWERGGSLAEVLGVADALPEILEADAHLRSSMASFRKRMGDDEAAIADAIALRLVEVEGDEVEILNPALFEIGREFALAGVPLRTIMQQARRLREAADNIAQHYVDGLVTQVSQALAVRGNEPDAERDTDELARMLQRLSALVTRSVDAALRQSMNDQLHAVLGTIETGGAPPAD